MLFVRVTLINEHTLCSKAYVVWFPLTCLCTQPRDPSYDIWAANTNPYESSWSWCQQNDTPTVPSSILSQWDGPHDMNMRSSWQSPGVESSSTNNAKNCAPQKAVEISLYPCDGEDQTVKGESPSCRSEKSYQRPYRPPACRTGEATVAPRVDRRDNWQRPHGRRGSVGRTGGPQPQGHRMQPHSIQFWGLPQPDRSSSGWQGKRLGGRYTSREDTGSWRAGGDSERARPDGEQTPPRERHGQHSRHQPNNSMVTQSISPLF
uniref:Uncharacterized protein n=1 Tax=Eptatretus burgeri TaxID=7764 RepID=A0A8C4QR19_EPTBU